MNVRLKSAKWEQEFRSVFEELSTAGFGLVVRPDVILIQVAAILLGNFQIPRPASGAEGAGREIEIFFCALAIGCLAFP